VIQNIDATVALLEAVRRVQGITRFIYAGSGNEIGRPLYIPIDEEHPLTPHNPYAFSKAAAELAVWSWYRAYDVPALIMSNGVVIGPNMRRDIFIFKWLWNIFHGLPILVEGGDQTRDVTYVTDVITAWLLAIEAPAMCVVGHKFQVSFGQELSVIDLAQICLEAAGANVPIKVVDYRPGERGQRECFSNKKAREVLSYCPQIGPGEAIALTAKWIKSLLL
jgi:nucleoside-diphosphate-sugar epimerase